VLAYDYNVLLPGELIKLQNGVLYYRQPLHNPTSVERLGPDCNIEHTNANQWIMPEVHNVSVNFTPSEENDLDNTFEGRIAHCPVLDICWTPVNLILQFQ